MSIKGKDKRNVERGAAQQPTLQTSECHFPVVLTKSQRFCSAQKSQKHRLGWEFLPEGLWGQEAAECQGGSQR